ncbi:MAG: hypothetical protein O3C27_07690 [Actinomycetota bacterium]|nr:hypothetical protein [Actinomycetota bacterium]
MGREVDRATRSVDRARSALGWQFFESNDREELDGLSESLDSLRASDPPFDELEDAIERAGRIADAGVELKNRIAARRRRTSTWVVVGGTGAWGGGGGSRW